ncbi:MAG: type I-E CRISPR-associated protein Cas5/CasD [Armatimonadetes bacterium]|jgi:CRISPR system Cascade subunit CasD|nr:type I-E CRISPR-associated protein Cas5/CasD [Armatimonadota bacterium]
MASLTLLLRFESVWQSWGARSRWDVRDTQFEPTKSGVVGLLGCALGYPVGDIRLEEELDSGLRYGVRVENPGRVVRDYQTVSDFLATADGRYKHSGLKTSVSLHKLRENPDATLATIVSPRFYLEDAGFLVALEETRHDGLLQRCADALKHPVWPIYLGRKACVPTRPVLEGLFDEYESIEDALRWHPWSWLGAGGHNRQPDDLSRQLRVYIEDESGQIIRQDAVRINDARQYSFTRMKEMEPVTPTKEDITECT